MALPRITGAGRPGGGANGPGGPSDPGDENNTDVRGPAAFPSAAGHCPWSPRQQREACQRPPDPGGAPRTAQRGRGSPGLLTPHSTPPPVRGLAALCSGAWTAVRPFTPRDRRGNTLQTGRLCRTRQSLYRANTRVESTARDELLLRAQGPVMPPASLRGRGRSGARGGPQSPRGPSRHGPPGPNAREEPSAACPSGGAPLRG